MKKEKHRNIDDIKTSKCLFYRVGMSELSMNKMIIQKQKHHSNVLGINFMIVTVRNVHQQLSILTRSYWRLAISVS